MPKLGRIFIEITSQSPETIQVTVNRDCHDPAIMAYAEALFTEIVRLWPGHVVWHVESERSLGSTPSTKQRRGGPAGTPQDQRIQIVRGWFNVRGQVNQEIYAQSQGVAPSTLRRWIRQLRDEGKL